MKKRLLIIIITILLIAVVVMLIVGSALKKQHETSAVPSQVSSYKKSDFVNFLERGMSYEDIYNKFGEPDVALGSGFFIPGYILEDNTKIELYFSPHGTGLEQVRLLESDAEIMNKDSKVIEVIMNSTENNSFL